MNLQDIVKPMLDWYDENQRDLPWRQQPSAYRIWISEIMLQQTRVEAVKEYYLRFLKKFPTIQDLATAKEEDLLKSWEGLGYYNRVRNMQKAAQVVVTDYNCELPNSYEELLQLPGIGSYTAGAIASIAYQISVPAVDGNVLRVMMRVLGRYDDIKKESTKTDIQELLMEIVPKRADAFNQAFMDLGSAVCIPNGTPKCEICPLRELCEANLRHLTDELPVQAKKKPRTIEEKTILIMASSSGIALHKRPAKGLLAGMYELPSLSGFCAETEVLQSVREWGYHPIRIEETIEAKHIFSHREWHMRSYKIVLDDILDNHKENMKQGFFFVTAKEIKEHYPLPSAFDSYRIYIT